METVIPLNGARPEEGSISQPHRSLFYETSVDALCDAVSLCQRHATAFDPAAIRQHALRFDRPEFKARITTYLADKMGITIA